MKAFYREHRAMVLALIPVQYSAMTALLDFLTDAMMIYLGWDGLLWQCTGALAMTLFVLGPVCFVCTGSACAYHSVKKIRSREQVGRHVILLLAGLATVVLSAAFFKWYWYKPV